MEQTTHEARRKTRGMPKTTITTVASVATVTAATATKGGKRRWKREQHP